MGFILNNKYVKGEVDMTLLRTKQNSTFKAHDQNRQRKDFAREIVQPRTRDGKANQAFIDAYPQESKEVYGFLPSDESLRSM